MTSDPRSREVAAFLDHLTVERRLSSATRAAYARGLADLLCLALGFALADMQTRELRRAVAQLRTRGLNGRTIARVLSSWRGFFCWLVCNGGVVANPAVGLRAPKVPKALLKALAPDEAQAFFDRSARNAFEAGDRAMFE